MAKTGLGALFDQLMNNAHLDEYDVANNSASLGAVSFVEFDERSRRTVRPIIEEMRDALRDKARFMLDMCVLNLLRQGNDLAPSKVTAIDMHFSTLKKTAFRTRYFLVLADFIKRSGKNILLNIKNIPSNVPPTGLCDLLRYLIPIIKNVSLQVSQDNILCQNLTHVSAKYYVLTVPELSRINQSRRREMTLEYLSQLPKYNKEVIVRNVTTIAPSSDLAYYL